MSRDRGTPDELSAAAADRRRVRRETLAIAFTAGLVAVVGVLGLWISVSATIRDEYGHYLQTIARTAALQIEPELHQSLREPAQRNSPAYNRAVEPLRRLRDALPDVRYLYTMVRDGELVRFVLDAAEPGDHDGDGIDDQAGLWEVYSDTDPAMVIALGTPAAVGAAAATEHPFSDKWGSFMTGWAPLLDRSGRQFGALGVDVDASVYIAHLERTRRWALLGLLPAALLIAGMTLGFYRIRMRSLTAARDAAAAARASTTEQLRLRNIIERTDVGIWEASIDASGNDIIIVDNRWAAMLGRKAEELNPMRPKSFFPLLVHPDDAPVARAAIRSAARESGRLLEIDVRMRHAKGHWVWTEVRGKVIERDASGRASHVVGTQVDVSARKAVEAALTEREVDFRSLFELSPVGICQADMQSGRFLKVNDALVASSGYTREELLQLTFWDVTPPRWHKFEYEHLTTLEQRGSFGPYEKEYQRKDGSAYPVLVSGLRRRDPAGRDVAWAIVQDISERKAMESELADAARLDKLTGLPNRTQFLEELDAAMERVRDGLQPRFAVLFLDFDRFKLVNDAMGHEAGDHLLREIASRLAHSLHALEGSVIARFGGDEFLVLINALQNSLEAERIAEQLLASLAQTYSVQGREVYSTASIGIVTSDQCLDNAEAVVRCADVAMYEAKRSGRARAMRFNDGMSDRLTRFVTIDSGLRKALGTPEFSLVYQPIVELETGRMSSVEALARWEHPQLGSISPSEFIPVAEESGLIVTLGQWVLTEACNTLALWRAQDPVRAPQTISVNISRAELALGERLLQRIRGALLQSGLPPQCLRLEVTERDAMRDPPAMLKLMHSLRALGVNLAMDDFGTGTSSLGCLRDYPFDVIKIDRSFISDVTTNPDVLAVIHAAVTLVSNLGKTSVAEGVEEHEQVAMLQSLGCHYAQGYYFSRPLSQQQLLEFMRNPQRPQLQDAAQRRLASRS